MALRVQVQVTSGHSGLLHATRCAKYACLMNRFHLAVRESEKRAAEEPASKELFFIACDELPASDVLARQERRFYRTRRWQSVPDRAQAAYLTELANELCFFLEDKAAAAEQRRVVLGHLTLIALRLLMELHVEAAPSEDVALRVCELPVSEPLRNVEMLAGAPRPGPAAAVAAAA